MTPMRTTGKALSWIIVAMLMLAYVQPVLAIVWPDCDAVGSQDDVSYATRILTPLKVSEYEIKIDQRIGENPQQEYPDDIFSWPMSYTGDQIDYTQVVWGAFGDTTADDIILTDFGSLAHYERTPSGMYIRHILGEDGTYWGVDYCPFCPWPCQCSFNVDSEVYLKNMDDDAANELLFLRSCLDTESEDYYCQAYGSGERSTQAFYIDYDGNNYDIIPVASYGHVTDEVFQFSPPWNMDTLSHPPIIGTEHVTGYLGYPTYTIGDDYDILYGDCIVYIPEGDMEIGVDYKIDYDYLGTTLSGVDITVGNLDGDSGIDFITANATELSWWEYGNDELLYRGSLTENHDDENGVIGNFAMVAARSPDFVERAVYAIQYNETEEQYHLVAYLTAAWQEIELDIFAECPTDIYPIKLFDDYTLLVKYGDLAIMYVGGLSGFTPYAFYEGAFNLRMGTYDYDGNGQRDLVGVFDGSVGILLFDNSSVRASYLQLTRPSYYGGDWHNYYVGLGMGSGGEFYAVGTGSSFLTLFNPLSLDIFCVGIYGYVFDAITGDPIDSPSPWLPLSEENGRVDINQSWGLQWAVLTDDGGFYTTTSTEFLFNGYCTYLNYSRTHDYNNYTFEFYPAECGWYRINASLIPLLFDYNGSAIVGTINHAFSNEFLNATVYIDNGTWNSSTTTNAWGFYMFDNLSDGCYWVNATADGYMYQNVSVCVNGTNYTIQSFLLVPDPVQITVWCRDGITDALICNYTLNIKSVDDFDCMPANNYDQTFVVTNCSQDVMLGWGIYIFTATAPGYYQNQSYYFVNATDNATLYLYPVGGGVGTYYPPRAVEFRVQTTWGTPISDVYVTAQVVNTTLPSFSWLWKALGWSYEMSEELVGEEMHEYTDTNGRITFIMVETLKYKMTFTRTSAPVVNETIYIYPKDEYYRIIVGTHWLTEESIWDTVNYTIDISDLNETHAYINFSYTDYQNETSELYYWINLTVLTNSTNLYNVTYTGYGNCALVTESYIVPRGQAYNIGFIAQHDDAGEIRHSIFIRIHELAHRLLELEGFPDWIYTLMSIGLLVGIAAIFNRVTIRAGTVTVPLCAWGLWFIGWLGWQNTAMPGILSIAMALGVILYIATGAREKQLT